MDCPCTPWGEMAGKVPREYNVSMDIHGLSAHLMGGDGWKVTREYNVSMDMHGLSAHPMGGDGCKSYSGNTMYPWISMDCPRTPWGEMAGKVTREYIVSMDPSFHGLSWGNYSFHGYQYCQISGFEGEKIRIAMIFFPGPGRV